MTSVTKEQVLAVLHGVVDGLSEAALMQLPEGPSIVHKLMATNHISYSLNSYSGGRYHLRNDFWEQRDLVAKLIAQKFDEENAPLLARTEFDYDDLPTPPFRFYTLVCVAPHPRKDVFIAFWRKEV